MGPIGRASARLGRSPWCDAALRRAFDLVGALFIAVLSLPLLALAGVAVALDSRGPVLYRQRRVGKQGATFVLLKLRTMALDAEADGIARWSTAGDRRITRIGRPLRRHRIDELPQLWNVIRGDMSLIGPRPERPEFVVELRRHIAGYDDRHAVRPGVTGFAQVGYRYGASIADAVRKHELDLEFLRRQSPWLDLGILAATLKVILSPSMAEPSGPACAGVVQAGRGWTGSLARNPQPQLSTR